MAEEFIQEIIKSLIQLLKEIAVMIIPKLVIFGMFTIPIALTIITGIIAYIIIRKPRLTLPPIIWHPDPEKEAQRQTKSEYEKHIENNWWRKFQPNLEKQQQERTNPNLYEPYQEDSQDI
jgi:hypothetical protein